MRRRGTDAGVRAKRRLGSSGVVVLFLGTVLATELVAAGVSRGSQGAASERLNGAWTNVSGDGGRSTIERGVDHAVDGLFALGKPTARSRLLEANPPIPRLRIDVTGASVRVDLGHGRNASAPPGEWERAQSATGGAVRVRYMVRPEGVLVMESLADGGSGRHTFRVSGDGSALRQDVRIESSRLPHDLRYTLEYRRAR